MSRKSILSKIIEERPDAVLVKSKYKVLAGMLRRMYPEEFAKIDYKKWEDIIFECVNADRDLRMLTEGFDKENKKILEQQWIFDKWISDKLK